MKTKFKLKSKLTLLFIFSALVSSLLFFYACKKKETIATYPHKVSNSLFTAAGSFTHFGLDPRGCHFKGYNCSFPKIADADFASYTLGVDDMKGEMWVTKKGGDTTLLTIWYYETNFSDSSHKRFVTDKLLTTDVAPGKYGLRQEVVAEAYKNAGLFDYMPSDSIIITPTNSQIVNVEAGTNLAKGAYDIKYEFVIPLKRTINYNAQMFKASIMPKK